MRHFVFAALAVVCSVGAAKAEQDCRLQLIAALPIETEKPWRVIVPAEVEGKPLHLALDTGAGYSALSQAAVDRLGLKTDIIPGRRPYLPYAGGEAKYSARTKDFKLGGMVAPKALFFVMPGKWQDSDGLIGADFLRHFDLEFDLAKHKLNIFAPHACPGQVVYWTNEAAVSIIPFQMRTTDESGLVSELDPHIRLDLTLDGKRLPAILDTGAPHTGINMMQAKAWFNLDENSPGMAKIGNENYEYVFKTLALEGLVVDNPKILIHTTDRARALSTEALLGMSVLRKLHFYIAYEERKLYVTAADAH